jgi:hypothetical protein
MPTTVRATDVETVMLRGGLSVPLVALRLLWDLEERGFSMIADDAGLVVSPRSRLTAIDDRAIRQHRDDLRALVQYCESGNH